MINVMIKIAVEKFEIFKKKRKKRKKSKTKIPFHSHFTMKINHRLGPKVSSSSTGKFKTRKSPYKIPSGNVEGRWTHDLFQQNRENTSSVSLPKPLKQGYSCRVSNLHPAASQQDVYTIFSQFGTILHLNFVPGQATFIFEDRESVTEAIEELNGKLADGNVLKVEFISLNNVNIVGASSSTGSAVATGSTITQPYAMNPLGNTNMSRSSGKLYSDRIEAYSSRLGSLVQKAAQEAAFSTVSPIVKQPHSSSMYPSTSTSQSSFGKKPIASRLGPVTKFSVTL